MMAAAVQAATATWSKWRTLNPPIGGGEGERRAVSDDCLPMLKQDGTTQCDAIFILLYCLVLKRLTSCPCFVYF